MTKDRVSALCRALDEQVELFRQRPLEGAYPYLWLDAKQVKVRDHGRVVFKAVVVAYAVHESGVREVIGLDVGEVESGAFWVEFLRSLSARARRCAAGCVRSARGAKGRDRRVLGCHGNAAQCTSLATWSCTAVAISAGSSPQHSGRSSTPRDTNRPRTGSRTYSNGSRTWRRRCARSSRRPRRTCSPSTGCRPSTGPSLRSTNPLERVNKEIGRRFDVVGIFPNDAAVIRLGRRAALEQNDEWLVQRRYLLVESMALILAEPPTPPSPAGQVEQEVPGLTAA